MKTPLALIPLVFAAACAGHHGPPASATADPWLRTRSSADCQQPACLFAVVVDSANRPIANAEVEIVGTSIQVTTNTWGRVAVQNIPLGSRAIRLVLPGAMLESPPVAFGMTFTSLVMEVRGEQLILKR